MLLSSDTARAVIDLQSGGRLASLQIDGVEILVTEGSGDTEWGCFPMAPWAGRVRNGRFEWRGEVHPLPIHQGPHALHGTVFGSSWRERGPNSIACTLGPDWPWSGEVRSFFSLSNSELVWRMEVHADSESFPVVLGWHPWFRRNLEGGEAVQVAFEAGEMYVRDAVGIPTGALIEPTPGPWDDCFTSVRRPPCLTWSHGLTVELLSSCGHWVVYSEPAHAVCIEPQSGPPDAFNLGGSDVAHPHQPVCHTLRFRWKQLGAS